MEYARLVDLYKELVSTTKRLEKTAMIAAFLKETDEDDLASVVYLIGGRVFPQWDGRQIGFSSRLLIKSIAAATGSDPDTLENELAELGDLGDVAAKYIEGKTQQTLFTETLSVEKVIGNLRKLSTLEGSGSTQKKIGLVAELLSNASSDQARFICRTVLEVLRIGIAEGIIRDAIAQAFEQDTKLVENAFEILVDYGEVATHAKEGTLEQVVLAPGRPLKLMLAVLSKNVEEAFAVVGKPAMIEYKYDGFRIQIHSVKGKITLFTRSMENVTAQFPDVVKTVEEQVKGKDFILDAEAVGYSPETKKYLPFQSISQRIKRKYDTETVAKKFPVEVHVFDVIYFEGKDLTETALEERRKLLEEHVDEKEKHIVLSKMLITEDEDKVNSFFKAAVDAGHEGLMFKSLEANYKPGRRVGYMAKLKGVMDALDLVIVQAEWGEGKRAQWLSSYTVACKKGDQFLEVGKVATGLKEKPEEGDNASFDYLTKTLKELIIKQEGKIVHVKAGVVVEVSYEEIQKSPTYASGYALRFPRILRVREDKPINEISSHEDIIRLYESQQNITTSK